MPIGYVCSLDYDLHLEMDYDGVTIYPSIESILANKKCCAGDEPGACGIYKVEIKKTEVVKEGNFDFEKELEKEQG